MTSDDSGLQESIYEHRKSVGYTESGSVPIEELEALADEWENPTHRLLSTAESKENECAQELRELVSEYE